MKCNLFILLSCIAAFVHAEPAVTNETESIFNPASFAATSQVESSESNVDPATLSVSALKLQAQESATAESLKWSIGNYDLEYASNVTAPPPIRAKPPKKAWLAKHKFDGVDFTLPTPDGVTTPFHGSRRHLQGTQVTTWSCVNTNRNKIVGSVKIWWGHVEGAATWACNAWLGGACKGSCLKAYMVTNSHWNCYRQKDLKFVGQASIWWGHEVGAGVWACNSWVSACGSSPGGCLVTGAAHWDNNQDSWSCNAYKQSDGCSGGLPWERDALRYACDQHDYCYYGPVKNDFADTYRHCNNLFYNEVLSQHWGGLDWVRIVGEAWKNAMWMDPVTNGSPVRGPGFGDGFQNRQLASDWECFLGKSKPNGYYVAPCQSGGGCAAGTSCYNCCDGDSGWNCNTAWWQ